MPKKKHKSDDEELNASYRETAPRLDLEFFIEHSKVMEHPELADRVRALHERILSKKGTRHAWQREYRRITSAYWAAMPWTCFGGAAQAPTQTNDETERESQADEERQIPEERAEATAASSTVGNDPGAQAMTTAARLDGNEACSSSAEVQVTAAPDEDDGKAPGGGRP